MKYKTTDDTALAAFLFLHDVQFVSGTVKTAHPRRRAFVFHDFEGLSELVDSFYNRTEHVAPLDFQEARAAISKFLKVDLSDKIKIKTEAKK